MSEKKNRILYIKQFMEEYADELHPVTISDILAHLENDGIEASRQTVTRELGQLSEAGIDIICNTGKPNQYFIGGRDFELPELKLLVDAVMASRFIPPKKVNVLIKKLSSFISTHQSGDLSRSLYMDKQKRPVDDRVYITIDVLYTAENTGKKIMCKYFDWSADKKKIYKHGNTCYYFSPYGLVWNNDRYYAIGWSDSHGKIITLRVDRIASPELTDRAAASKPKDFDIAYYAERVINMYDGEVCDITLHCENSMMKHIIDRFGEEVETEIIDTKHFAVHIRVPASPTFFSWVFTFGNTIRIAEPEEVVKSYQKMLKEALY